MTDRQMPGLLPVARGFCLFLCLILGTVVCFSEAARSGDVRLVGGANKYEGTVLVMSRGIWKSVCSLGWDVLDATVVCRQLGFRGIRRFFRWSKFGDGNLDRLKVKFSCRGNEYNLLQCARRLRRSTHLLELCSQNSRSAGVVCKADRTTTVRPTTTRRTTPQPTTTTTTTTTRKPTTPKPTTPKPTTILPSSSTSSSSRKLNLKPRNKENKDIKKNKINTADSSAAAAANRSRPLVKSDSGINEISNNLKDDKREILKDEGTGSNTVGSSSVNVNLKDVRESLSGSTDHKDASAAGSSSDIDDRNNKEKKKIKVKEPEDKETEKEKEKEREKEKQKQKEKEKEKKKEKEKEKQKEKEKEKQKEKEKEKEKQKEKEKERKKSGAHTDNSSDRKEDKSDQIPEPEKESAVDQSKDSQEKEPKFKVALNGGRYAREGHVAIKLHGQKKWGVICGDHWTYYEGKVVCRQLGFGLVKKIYQGQQEKVSVTALNSDQTSSLGAFKLGRNQPRRNISINYYGGTHLPKLLARVRCHGNESHLADCQRFEYVNQVKCSKSTSVAGVICTTELPDLVPDAKALQESVRLEDRPLYYLTCSMEENCLADEAYEIKEKSQAWITASRRLLRFSSIVFNHGTADFVPNSPKDAWEWHQCHMHYHSMEVFAHYDIMDMQGNRVAQGHKASFCLEDTRCPPGITPKYNCLGFGDQGLSINCSDNYYHDIDCQWIDITGMKYGNYVLKVEFNPHMSVSEITFDNNVVECSLYYTGTYAYLRKCDITGLQRSD